MANLFLLFYSSIAAMGNGIVRKRVTKPEDNEVMAYRKLTNCPYGAKIVPKFMGICQQDDEHYIELQNLLQGFDDPNVMDIKIGTRTFSESEVANGKIREDLYKKMIALDPNAPTEEEHLAKGITKLRYMMFRENMSSSQDLGFRIDALKKRGSDPVRENLHRIRTDEEIVKTMSYFVDGRKSVTKEILKRLKQMRSLIEKSEFFQTHEIVGSSVFLVFDDNKVGVWLIDFAKSKQIPLGLKINHRRRWIPGNCEEGLLHGIDRLIDTFDAVYETQCQPNMDLLKCVGR